MTCEAFLDRLYDDDARAAERGQGTIPPEMARHMLVCEVCRSAYDSAVADELLLTHALLDSPPPAWRAGILRQTRALPARGLDPANCSHERVRDVGDPGDRGVTRSDG